MGTINRGIGDKIERCTKTVLDPQNGEKKSQKSYQLSKNYLITDNFSTVGEKFLSTPYRKLLQKRIWEGTLPFGKLWRGNIICADRGISLGKKCQLEFPANGVVL